MIIYLDKTISIKKELTEDEIILFTELAFKYKQGKCFLCGNIDTIEFLITRLNGVEKAIYKNIRNHNSEVRSIISFVKTLIVLTYDEKQDLPTFMYDKEIFRVNIYDAINEEINFEPTLLCENLNDCKLYNLVAKWYIKFYKIKGITTKFHNELGGGNTIDTSFEKCIIDDKVLTLGIVDSDKKYDCTKLYPTKPTYGETAKRLENAINRIKEDSIYGIYEMFCLDVHEVENILPISVLDQIKDEFDKNMEEGIEFLKILLRNGKEKAILLYDFKRGEYSIKTEPSIAYWLKICSDVEYKKTMPPLNKRVLENAIIIINNIISENREIVLDDYLIPIWDMVGKTVLSWGCSNKIMYT